MTDGEGREGALPVERIRLALGAFLAANTMVFHWMFYGAEVYGEAARNSVGFEQMAGLFGTLLWFLASCTLVLLAPPLLEDVHARASGSTGLLILIAAGAAYALSVVNVLRGEGPLYFDALAAVLLLTTVGKALEARARRRASGAEARALPGDGVPYTVNRDGVPGSFTPEKMQREDIVTVAAGQEIPVDGAVLSGLASVDERRLTGEAHPRSCEPGSTALAGGRALDGELVIHAQAVGDDRRIARIVTFLSYAGSRLTRSRRIADRAAVLFLPVVLTLAAITLARGQLLDAMSVLLIGCPCALAIAPSVAMWTARRVAAEKGMLFGSLEAIERTALIRKLLLDKTGTITEARMQIRSLETIEGVEDDRVLAIAAALEKEQPHPAARALADAGLQTPGCVATDIAALAGIGVEGTIDGRTYRIGNVKLLTESDRDLPPSWLEEAGAGCVLFLVGPDGPVARFLLEERLRPGTEEVIGTLREQQFQPELVSGDTDTAVKHWADRLGIPGCGDLDPLQKVALVRSRKEASGCLPTALIGDGWNDAPAMSEADLGISVGDAAPLAKSLAEVHLLEGAWPELPQLFQIAREARRRLHLALGWGFFYNSIGLTLAATGRLSPVFAASAMALSSLMTLRLARVDAERNRP
jgi:Cu2+-exporting ATPase